MIDARSQPNRKTTTAWLLSQTLIIATMTVAAMPLLLGCGKPNSQPLPNVPLSSANKTETAAEKPTAPTPSVLVDKTFDDILFDIEPDAPYDKSMLTDAIRNLDGKRIRIRGYILPTARKRGLKQFVLVRDNQECCFGPGAALFDCILVEMLPDQTAEFSIRPVAVEGEFQLSEFIGPDGTPLAIYRLRGEAVR